jgi:hypothetical protein
VPEALVAAPPARDIHLDGQGVALTWAE